MGFSSTKHLWAALLAAAGSLGSLAGCSGLRAPAEEATKGAISGVKESAGDERLSTLSKEATKGAIDGLTAQTEDEQRRERARRFASQVAEDVARGIEQTSPAIEAMTRRSAAAAVDAALERRADVAALAREMAEATGESFSAAVLRGLETADRKDELVERLSRSAGAGTTAGIVSRLNPLLAALAFLAGIVLGGVATALALLVRARRDGPRARPNVRAAEPRGEAVMKR